MLDQMDEMMKYWFELPSVSEKTISPADFKSAAGLIVIFSCNHCPYVIGSEQRMIALHEKYAAKGYPVIAINSNDPVQYPQDSFENMKVRAADRKFPFEYLFDETQEIAQRFGAERTPHVFLLEKHEEELSLIYEGGIDNSPRDARGADDHWLETVLDAAIDGKPLPYSKKQPVGCSIKWK